MVIGTVCCDAISDFSASHPLFFSNHIRKQNLISLQIPALLITILLHQWNEIYLHINYLLQLVLA